MTLALIVMGFSNIFPVRPQLGTVRWGQIGVNISKSVINNLTLTITFRNILSQLVIVRIFFFGYVRHQFIVGLAFTY